MIWFLHQNSYKILAASQIKDNTTAEKAAAIILETVALDTELYRLGKTKVLIPNDR